MVYSPSWIGKQQYLPEFLFSFNTQLCNLRQLSSHLGLLFIIIPYTSDNILINHSHFRTVLMLLKMVVEYCHCVEDIPTATPDILSRLVELLKVCCIEHDFTVRCRK